MKNTEKQSADLATYAVLVSSTGEILDVRTHNRVPDTAVTKLKGRSYANECASRFRVAIKELLNRERQLLSVVMPPPTLGVRSWFAVVGVPIGPSQDGGALFVHMDISTWIEKSGTRPQPANKISMDLLQQAMATTLIDVDTDGSVGRKSAIQYDGIESLTTRQREVLELIGTGKSNVEIAKTLSCSLNTVKRHVTAVLQKLRLPNRTRAAMFVNKLHSEQH